MKKFALLLAVLMTVSLFAACGGETEPASDPVTEPTPETVTEPVSEPVTLPEIPTNPTPDPDPDPDPEREDDGAFLVEDAAEFEKEFTGYETITVENSKLQEGDLPLIDADHVYDSANADDIVRVKDFNYNGYASVTTSGVKLNFTAVRKMQEMNCEMQNALKVTYLLCIQAGYVTGDELADLHANYPGEYPEESGKSDLHTGKAAVLSVMTGAMNYDFRNDAVKNVAQWVTENAHKYGFIFGADIGSNAKLRYVGVPHATYMQENEMDLAEYLTKLQDGNKLQITDYRNLTWTVYRVAASEGQTTELQVPAGMSYSISGDNNGGFIVTVKGVCQ